MNEQPRGGAEFALYNHLLLRAEGNYLRAAQIAELEAAPIRVQRALHTKATVLGNDTSNAAALVDQNAINGAWLDSQVPFSAFERINADNTAVRGSMTHPVRVTTVVPQAATTVEGAPKPATATGFSSAILATIKSAAIIVVTKPTINLPNAASFISRQGRIGLGAATDCDFFTAITAGGVPSAISSGASAANVLADVGALLEQMNVGAGSALYLLAPSAVVARVATKNVGGLPAFDVGPKGGTVAGIPLVCCEGGANNSPDDSVLLVDASGIVIDPGSVSSDVSEQTSIQMDDAPSGAAQHVSMFQTNSVALRFERQFGAARARGNAVVQLTGVQW